MPWLGYACGSCEYCSSGWKTLCASQLNTGYSINGTFADYTKAFARYVVKVPAGIDPLDAAPLACAGVTTYKAVKVSGARSSDPVAVFGIGGLGHLAVQYAVIAGATVVAVDIVDEKLNMARSLGATCTVNALREDPAAFTKKLGGANAAIWTAASAGPIERAHGSLKRGGMLVMVGLPVDADIRLPIFGTVLHGIRVIGSIVGKRLDLAEVFQLHAAGRTRVIRDTRQRDNVNEAIAEVLSGHVDARIVFPINYATPSTGRTARELATV